MMKFLTAFFAASIAAVVVALYAAVGYSGTGPVDVSAAAAASATSCSALASQTFEGNTSVSSAAIVTGTFTTAARQTIDNLPEFCRVV